MNETPFSEQDLIMLIHYHANNIREQSQNILDEDFERGFKYVIEAIDHFFKESAFSQVRLRQLKEAASNFLPL